MAGNPAGSRNVEVYEKVEQVGEGTYGCEPPETQAGLWLWLPARPPP